VSVGATKYIGQRIIRREDPRFLTGRTRYVDDIRLAGTVHAAFVRCPYAHAEVRAVRTAQAAVHDGVVGVLTGEEAARLSRPIRGDSAWPGWKGTEFPVLSWPRVHFVGQAVAVVAAIDRYVAEDAAELVEADYHPLPVAGDVRGCRGRLRAGGPRLGAYLPHPSAYRVSVGGPCLHCRL
jgi:carbon-monoxide dehydrogenase large subunit